MKCPCGKEVQFPLSPQDLYEHREHLIEAPDGKQLRIDFTRTDRSKSASIGFDFRPS